VDGELAQDGGDDVPVPDVVLGAFFGEGFDGLERKEEEMLVRGVRIWEMWQGLPLRGKCSRSKHS
jgi:hypothetical protein